MAIQNRMGLYKDFNPEKLLPGEWAVVLSGDPKAADGTSVYMCFNAGKVKRMATYEDMVENINVSVEDIKNTLTQSVQGLEREIQDAEKKRKEEEGMRKNAETERVKAEVNREKSYEVASKNLQIYFDQNKNQLKEMQGATEQATALANEAERIIGSVRPAYIVVSAEDDQEIVKLNNPIRFLNTILTNQEFELSENGVYIAGGVKHVRVSGSIQGKAMQATGYIGIFVNGKITAHKYAYTSVAGTGHCVIPEVILSVKDGDSITICPTDAFPLNGINRAEMTVEKID